MSVEPRVNAMLLCDTIITDKITNKKSLIGIFENIHTIDFPCIHYSLSLYIKLTNAKGNYIFRLELVDLEKDVVIGKEESPKVLNIDDPLRTFELLFEIRGLTFEHPGKYEFIIFANDSAFGQKIFEVRKLSEGGY